MDGLGKWLRLGVPSGWADVVVRTAKAAVIAFVALQVKEYLDARELDIPACAIDGAWVAAGTFAVNAVLLWASPAPARRGSASG
jgi:hypothetical protein